MSEGKRRREILVVERKESEMSELGFGCVDFCYLRLYTESI